MREYMITVIKSHWSYEDGQLETMSDKELREVFENLLDWLGE